MTMIDEGLAAAGLHRPVPVFDPAKGLLHNDHFQLGYVTNDIDRAVATFRDRFGIAAFRVSDDEVPGKGRIQVRSAWIGRMMFEVCSAEGPGFEVFTVDTPPDEGFVLRLHHFGYLVADLAAWADLERVIADGGWQVRSRSEVPGYLRACMIEAPELGHLLEFVLPGAALLARLNATPIS